MLSYVHPVRHDGLEEVEELAGYVNQLVTFVDDVLVVDGSPARVFAAFGTAFDPAVVDLRPDSAYSFANGKVDGVLTGVREARHERVVVADDDVRWDEGGLRRMAELLSSADVVRPQNYFDPLPWQPGSTRPGARQQGVRRRLPGALGVRRSVLLELGGMTSVATRVVRRIQSREKTSGSHARRCSGETPTEMALGTRDPTWPQHRDLTSSDRLSVRESRSGYHV